MAESASTIAAEKQSNERIDIEMSAEEEGVQQEKGEVVLKEGGENNETADTEDPFKKPAIFAVPSLLSRRAGAPVSSGAKHTAATPGGSKDAISCAKFLKSENTEIEKAVQESKENGNTGSLESSKDRAAKEKCPQEAAAVENEPVVGVTSSSTSVKSVAASSAQASKPRLPAKAPDPMFKSFPPLPYTEPLWGGLAETCYSFEILKNGAILDTVPLTERSFFVIGRLPNCDVSLEHPSISRYHAVVQYRQRAGDAAEEEEAVVGEQRGFYVFDLGSTHGTFVNKNRIPPKTYIRLRVGHVLKFGGSTRLFILQGPESDAEAESELSITELKELSKKRQAELEKRMMGEGSDEEKEEEEEGQKGRKEKSSGEEAGCSWGMGEDALPEEDDNEENPFAMEFQEDQEAFYLKDPKKALQGFFDREGEELEYEYDDKGHGTWTCRVCLPVDDAVGKQLVAEVTHTGKKKEAAIQCALEACRILEARGLLRQEAVSRKRRKKNWEDEDFYDSDDDTFLDRTGVVEKKRTDRMKKAGKIEEKPDTYESLVAKLSKLEKELAETEQKLSTSGKTGAQASSEDPLEVFMSAVRSGSELDSVARRKLHVRMSELRKEEQRLRRLVEITRPTQLPSLQLGARTQSTETDKPKKLSLPLFGAMKGGSKFRLKTGTIGRLPPKRADLPPELFNMKELSSTGEVEEEEEEEEEAAARTKDLQTDRLEPEETSQALQGDDTPKTHSTVGSSSGDGHTAMAELRSDTTEGEVPPPQAVASCPDTTPAAPRETHSNRATETKTSHKKKMMRGPSRPPTALLAGQYPEDDPNYSVWVPPSGQTGDGRTHLNEKYGY
ncbi:kanadaptin isoform X2 [Amia ocellicauda]|uniref:kanadaptin isoform X2 n=1 Tax=Amia ocellicauda TaxID=2972642 RepID=UPI003463BD29